MTTAEPKSVTDNGAAAILPCGTRVVTLEELVDPFPSYWGADNPTSSSTEFSVLGVGNVTNDGALDLTGASRRHLEPDEFSGVAKEGDLLVVKSSGSATNIRSGKTAICPPELSGKIACSNFMMRLVVRCDVADPYLLWLILNSHLAKNFVREIVATSTYPNIKWENYRRFSFPLPPLAEQRRVAGRLREQLAAVAQARAAVQAQLDAAQALPAAHLRVIFESAVARQWQMKRVEHIIARPLRTGLSKPPSADSKARCLTLSAVRNGILDYSASKTVAVTEKEALANAVQSETLYVVRGNGNISLVARGALAPTPQPHPVLFPDLLIEVHPNRSVVLPHYLRWVWESPEVRRSLETRSMTSAGIYKINLTNLATVEIPVPSIPEQETIIEKCEAAAKEQATLRESITARLTALDHLPTALLREAFGGTS